MIHTELESAKYIDIDVILLVIRHYLEHGEGQVALDSLVAYLELGVYND